MVYVGTIWKSDICWQRNWGDGCDTNSSPLPAGSCLPFDGRVTPDRLCAWLRALAARVTMPPPRKFTTIVQHYPSSLAAWFRLLETLLRQVPPHWLVRALHPLLCGGKARRAFRAWSSPLGAGDVPEEMPLGAWPAATGRQEAWDMGVAARGARPACSAVGAAAARGADQRCEA